MEINCLPIFVIYSSVQSKISYDDSNYFLEINQVFECDNVTKHKQYITHSIAQTCSISWLPSIQNSEKCEMHTKPVCVCGPNTFVTVSDGRFFLKGNTQITSSVLALFKDISCVHSWLTGQTISYTVSEKVKNSSAPNLI